MTEGNTNLFPPEKKASAALHG